ncbi:MAG: RecX family transcriptional regulator [Clostridia bacterium]|nr:RecX family transcriptional regulator [Clostridia bacterium]
MNDLPIIKIIRLARAEDPTLVTVTVTISADGKSEKRYLLLPEAFVIDERLAKGEISPEEFERIEKESKKCRAYLRGANILGYGANSEKKLTEKLQKRGFDRESAAAAAKKLQKDGFIDEENDAANKAFACARKLWGKKRIVAKLYESGYREDTIKAAVERLSEVDFVENCKKLIAKKVKALPTDRKELDKLIAFLIRYGYSLSEIKSAYSNY